MGPCLSVLSVILSAAFTALGNGMMATFVPLLATGALQAFGPSGFWMFVIALAGGLALFVLWRTLRRERAPEEMREEFHALPSSPHLPELGPYDDEFRNAAGDTGEPGARAAGSG